MSSLVEHDRGSLSLRRACEAVGLARATRYRRRQPTTRKAPRGARAVPRKLSAPERARVLAVLLEPRFVDQPPAEIYATLLSEGRFVASERTMYRVLRENEAVRERRAQRVHPKPHKPVLVATAPNQVWTWDITAVAGPAPRTFFYVYVLLDLFSRYVVGWLVSPRQNGDVAAAWMRETAMRRGIDPSALVLHSDRGSPMKSGSMVELCERLGVRMSFSRPRVSDDNPFVESQFKTAKYQPDYPDRFASVAEARSWFDEYFRWYNEHHHHAGLALYTPSEVHEGRVEEVARARQRALDAAYAEHPERFVKGPPVAKHPPALVGINHVPAAIPSPEPAPQASLCPSPAPQTSARAQARSRAPQAASNASEPLNAASTSARSRPRRNDGGAPHYVP